jgi:F-type H+-transporting ATPase subunit delta
VEDTGIQQNGSNGEFRDESENGELRTDAVSQVYAEALMEMAEATGELQSIADEVDELGQLLQSQPGLVRLLSTRTLSHEQRRESLERLFKDNVSNVLYKFLHVINDKGRLSALPAITRAFSEQMAQRNGIVEADVWVPKLMEQDQVDQIGERLAAAIGAQQVVVHQYKDHTLIGGLKIRVGDTLIDASVATQLRRMRQRMTEAGRAKARELTAVDE